MATANNTTPHIAATYTYCVYDKATGGLAAGPYVSQPEARQFCKMLNGGFMHQYCVRKVQS